MTNQLKLLVAVFVSASLFSCGGGGGDDSAPTQQDNSISVNAGPDLTVIEQTTITLAGEASSADPNLTYTWSAAPSLAITHDDQSSAAATFIAPTVIESTEYTLTLSVTGALGGQAQDEAIITVAPNNIAPVAIITTPSFLNVTEGSIPAGDTIVLNSAASTDADAPDTERQIRGWEWQQTAGTNVLASSETNQPSLTFVAPVLDNGETISFSLTVTDAEGATDTTQVDLNLLAARDTPPKVSAGLDQFVFSGETIVLAGTAETTVSASAPLIVEWESGVSVNINTPNQADTFAVGPLVETSTDIVMVLSVTDSFGNEVTDTLTVNVRPAPFPTLNDTGVTFQGTATDVFTSHQNAFPGQDAQRGQDRIELNGFLEKAGRGRVGFDFTPLNNNGDEMDDLAEPWNCVRDNTTGFVWEVKSDDGLLHDQDATYSWYQTDNNGGFEGDENNTDTSCSLTMCNTEAYVTEVNENGLCGFYDWRLPNHDELMSIIDFGSISGPKIDDEYFPNIGTESSDPVWYWTSQPGADGVSGDSAQNAWALDFTSGVDNFLNKSTPARIRLVRAGR